MLAIDLGAALPLFASPAHADRIADRCSVPEDVVELTIMRPNDDRSGPLGTVVGYGLSRELRFPVRDLDSGDVFRLAPEVREGVREVSVGGEIRRSRCVASRDRKRGGGNNKNAS